MTRLEHRRAQRRLQAICLEVGRRAQIEALARVCERGHGLAQHHSAHDALAVVELERVDLGRKADRRDHSLRAVGRRAREQRSARAGHARSGLEGLLFEDLGALRHRGQRLRDLAQSVQGIVQLGRLPGDSLEDARVLDRDPGHRPQLIECQTVALVEGASRPPETDSADDAGLPANRRERFVHRVRGRIRRNAARRAVLREGVISDQRRAVTDPLKRTGQRHRAPSAVEEHVSVIRLEKDDAARVVADHVAHAVEHEGEYLVHRLARRLFDELAHQRVAGRLLLALSDGVCAGKLRSGPPGEGHRQPAIVVVETARAVPEQDEAAHVRADQHRHGQQALDVELVRNVVEQLGQPGLVDAHEVLAPVDGRQQRPRPFAAGRDRLRVQTAQTDARRLRHEPRAVRRDQVVAGKGCARLLRDQGGQRSGVPRLVRAVQV